MVTEILAFIGALSGLGALVNSILTRRADKVNSRAVIALESGKLDASVAELGHHILVDTLSQLRLEVTDCHKERDEFKYTLQAHGLLPTSGSRKGDTHEVR